MKGGFDANVPARKPRTKIGRVISELTSDPQPGTTAEAVRKAEPEADAATEVTVHPLWSGGARDIPPHGPGRVSGGREQIARLRERLSAAARPRGPAAEAKETASAVRERIEGLRARLEESTRERAELSEALEQARAALSRAEGELVKERRTRAALEAQAEERRRIADDAVAEAEALAAERDQVLYELAELRRLEADQAELLTEAEAELARRDAERESAAHQLAEMRSLVDLRSADAVDLEARLEDEAAGRARAEARCRELEAEVARLSDAREALESIEAMLARGG
jgi:DNA repair exonuclease SbcCD ATPase subunit